MPSNFTRSGLKRLWRPPNKLKPDEKVEEPNVVEQAETEVPVNPLQEFFDDMQIIMRQVRDPYLKKPSFDIGGPVFSNYLKWLQLAELMKLTRNIDRLTKEVKECLNKS